MWSCIKGRAQEGHEEVSREACKGRERVVRKAYVVLCQGRGEAG